MDKNTLSNYGWIVIAVLVLSVMIALATPFGEYIKAGVESTTAGLFDTSEKALNVVGMSATGENNDTSNLITDYSFINNKALSPNDGSVIDNKPNYMVTDFIPCKGSYSYTVTENQTFAIPEGSETTTRCLVYNENKELVKTAYVEQRTEQRVYTHSFVTVPQAAYFRIQFRMTDSDIVITEDGLSDIALVYQNYSYVQGICASENYLFVSYSKSMGSNNNDYQIRKIDRNTGDILSTSTEYYNHANGMTYNKNTNEIIVCALNGNTGLTVTTSDDDYSLYIVDADTLTLKETVNLKDIVKSVCAESVGISGITYSSEYNEYYALTRYPERYIVTLNSDFTLKDSVYLYHYDDVKGTTGDICFDGTYFYIPTWLSQYHNDIALYSKDGTFVNRYNIIGATHIESIEKIGNMFYISFINNIGAPLIQAEVYATKSISNDIIIP